MNFKKAIYVIAAIATAAFCAATASAFAAEDEPLGQVLGYYSKGSLEHATALQFEGKGFTHLFRDRNRHFGSLGMIQMLENVAASMTDLYPEGERLQIGDVAAEFGGQISGHASHQNGLDADIVYFRTDHAEQPLSDNQGFIEKFVVKGEVTANFDRERNFKIITLIYETGRLNRIFVDPAIKKALCGYAARSPDTSYSEILRRLRPYAAHDDHMHVRMTCPSASPKCIAQDELPAGSGC